MRRDGWHILREDRALTLARALPARFDVSFETSFPRARKGRLAQQIRQDMWRTLQDIRGFSPVVRVEEDGTHLKVRAGGAIQARTFPKNRIEAQISALLSCPKRRARWMRHAKLEVADA